MEDAEREGRGEDLPPYLYLPAYAQITSGRRHKKRVVLAPLHAEQLAGWDQERLCTTYTLLYL